MKYICIDNSGFGGYCGYEDATHKSILDVDGKDFCTKCIAGFFNCHVKYDVLIHNSKETLINDLESDPIVVMKNGEAKLAKISKTNMDSIATKQNPCIEEGKLIRTACDIQKVFYVFNRKDYIHSIFTCFLVNTSKFQKSTYSEK